MDPEIWLKPKNPLSAKNLVTHELLLEIAKDLQGESITRMVAKAIVKAVERAKAGG